MFSKSFITWFACWNAWNMKSSLVCSFSKNAMSTFANSLTWFFNICQSQQFTSILLLQSTLVACLSIGSCKVPRFFVTPTSSKTIKNFFDIMHCLIWWRYSSTYSSLHSFLLDKYCKKKFGHDWCLLISHHPRSYIFHSSCGTNDTFFLLKVVFPIPPIPTNATIDSFCNKLFMAFALSSNVTS